MSVSPIVDVVQAMGPDERKGALTVLDMLSRPLTPREIEGAMLGTGVSRTQRKIVTKAIKALHIIALVGPDHG